MVGFSGFFNMVAPLYRGFSTVANQGVQTKLENVALVKQDLLNQFNTRLDERVGRPRYGRVIWDLLFDLSDPRTEALIVADAERIVASDPRVELLQLIPSIDIDAHRISLDIKLRFVEFNMDDNFSVVFREIG